MSTKIIIKLLIAGVLLTILGGIFVFARWTRNQYAMPDTNVTAIMTPAPTPSATPTPEPTRTTVTLTTTPSPTPKPALAATINLDVPFTSQSPFANWDAVHEETCEEAAILMAAWYAQSKKGEQTAGYTNRIDPDVAESALQDLVTWQKEKFGYFEDTTVDEVVIMAKEKLGLKNVSVETNVTSRTLKDALNAGNVIVIPAAGQLLKNPYFKQPGPPYHMLLIRGYNDQGFITNDPGTRRGEGFVYSEANMLESIHDWTGRDAIITQGRKAVIIVGKN